MISKMKFYSLSLTKNTIQFVWIENVKVDNPFWSQRFQL